LCGVCVAKGAEELSPKWTLCCSFPGFPVPTNASDGAVRFPDEERVDQALRLLWTALADSPVRGQQPDQCGTVVPQPSV
jgi:hypothetical protein